MQRMILGVAASPSGATHLERAMADCYWLPQGTCRSTQAIARSLPARRATSLIWSLISTRHGPLLAAPSAQTRALSSEELPDRWTWRNPTVDLDRPSCSRARPGRTHGTAPEDLFVTHWGTAATTGRGATTASANMRGTKASSQRLLFAI